MPAKNHRAVFNLLEDGVTFGKHHRGLHIINSYDAEPLYEMIVNNPDIPTFITWAHEVKDVWEVQDFIIETHKKDAIRCSVTNGNTSVGYAALYGTEIEGEFAVSYFLHPEVRGQGYASGAAKKLIEIALNFLDAHSIIATIADENTNSQSTAVQLGFHRTGMTMYDDVLQLRERIYRFGPQ